MFTVDSTVGHGATGVVGIDGSMTEDFDVDGSISATPLCLFTLESVAAGQVDATPLSVVVLFAAVYGLTDSKNVHTLKSGGCVLTVDSR